MEHKPRPKIYYTLEGLEKAPVIVFSHSLASSSVMWEPQAHYFQKEYRILRFDTRGQGRSEVPPGPYTFEVLAEDVLDLLDRLQIDKVHFIGLSMGGMIGQSLAFHHPDRLLSLTLSNTSVWTDPSTVSVWETRIRQVRSEGLKILLNSTMQRWFTDSFRAKRPPIYEAIEQQFLATPVEGYVGCVQAIMELDNRDRLGTIRTPTLVLTGSDDSGSPVPVAEEIHQQIKGSKFFVIPGARHLSNAEFPDQWNRLVENFLRNL